jgi:glycine/D-amino acid oxidase-like deaminating enzyme
MWPFRRRPDSNASLVRSSQPYWLVRDGIGDALQTLHGSLECDVAIVGAGITGALIADALVDTGARIVLLDAREPAQGSTAACTALLQYELDTHLVELTSLHGAEAASLAYLGGVRSFSMIEQRFPELLRQCGYERRECLYLAEDEAALPALEAEGAARREIGIHVDWLAGEELLRRYGCHRPGALLSPLAATLDPVRFTRALLAVCVRRGVRLYSRARVESIDGYSDDLALAIEGGRRVRARHVIVAAGYESLRFLPSKVADIDNTFALVTEPLRDPAWVAGLPQIWESARPYLYLRGTADGRIMIGGADVPFSSPQARDALLARQVRSLASAFEKLFGLALPPIAFCWGGSFGKTADGLPFIGRVPGMHDGLQFALCYGGNGICYALQSSEMIRDGVEGRPHALDAIFGFGRSPVKSGVAE